LDERRFSQAGGRISQCLAAERRISKDVRRVGQLQAAKVSGMSGKSITFKDFPRQAGLDAQELPGEHRLHKDVRRLA